MNVMTYESYLRACGPKLAPYTRLDSSRQQTANEKGGGGKCLPCPSPNDATDQHETRPKVRNNNH